MRLLLPVALAALFGVSGFAQTALWQRGYSVVPAPREVRLEGGDVFFGRSWRLEGISTGIAARSLWEDFSSFHSAGFGNRGPVARLAVAAGTVPRGGPEGYRLRVSDAGVEITGNGEAGLFYGVQTLVQLLRSDAAGRLRAPRCVIEDWPEVEWRFLHWDTGFHQDRIETLKRYLDWAARFKANRIAFQLEDKFEYPSHPVIGAPGAFTTAELQEIVDYGLERHIQIVPLVQAPAHMAYALKHPEFAPLREDGNNYQATVCDPRTYDLIFSMYDDVIRATRGVGAFFVSTDEVYYAGIDPRCGVYNETNRSLRWIEFVRKAHDFMTARGRRMLIWAEYPLLPEHAHMIPPDIVDGVIGNAGYIPAEKKLGMRQLAYVWMQGTELLFPDYFPSHRPGNIERSFDVIRNGRHRQLNPIGVFGAMWDASGLHNETYWLGWSAAAQAAWNPRGASPEEHAAAFFDVYYGPRVTGMYDLYRAMQNQARAWEKSWDRVVSRVRPAGYGNSYGKGIGTTKYDQTFAQPAMPRMPDLAFEPAFGEKYAKLLQSLPELLVENDRLVHAIEENLPRAERNRYNLEVYLALARFIGHQWRLAGGLAQAEVSLAAARDEDRKGNARRAVGNMVSAHNTVRRLETELAETFGNLTAVFEQSRYPKGRTVNGRKFVQILDDTKDLWADRRPDLTYMTAPEESIGLKDWRTGLYKVIESYAQAHNVPVRGPREARLEQ